MDARRDLNRFCNSVLLLAVSSCVVDGSLGGDAPQDAAVAASMAPSDSHESVGGNSGSEAHAPDAAGTSPQPAATSSSEVACTPIDGESPCLACQKAHCCTEFSECVQHTVCDCVSECLVPGTTHAECRTHCGVLGSETDALEHCVDTACAADCR
jgi:hypothetical protein